MRQWLLAILLVCFGITASAKTAYAYLQTAEATPIHMYPQEAFDAPVGAIPVSITFTQMPQSGQAVVEGTRPHVVYTPNKFFAGKDTIRCRVTTSNTISFDAVLYITVSNAVSSSGTDFWITFLHNSDQVQEPTYNISVATIEEVKVKIVNPSTGWTIEQIIPAEQVVDIEIPLSVVAPDSSEQVSGKGFHVMSTKPIALYACSFAFCSSDATSVIPTIALGDKYVVQTWATSDTVWPPEFAIVAVEDNTVIDIHTIPPTQKHPGPADFSCVLNRGETYHVQTSYSNLFDMSGSTIDSHGKKIAVFEGNMSSLVYASLPAGAGDHMYEQAVPVNLLGTEFILPDLSPKQTDFVKVTAVEDGTMVNYCFLSAQTGTIKDTTILLNAHANWVGRRYCDFLSTSKPVLCGVFMPSSCTYWFCDDNEAIGDPAMVVVSPTNQKLHEAFFGTYSAGRAFEHRVVITGKNVIEKDILLDGLPIGPNAYPNPVYHKVVPISAGVHHLQCDSGIVAYVSGYKWYESYAYCVATQYREMKDTFVVINDTICQNQEYHFGSLILTETGTYYDTITNSRWNDSITQLNLFVIPSLTRDTVVYDTICHGDTLLWNGIKCSKDSIYTATLQTIMGCDSMVKLDLTLRQWEFHEDSTILLGTSIEWHGKVLSVGGVYRDTASSMYGCDSINILHLYTIRAGDDNPPDPYPFLPVVDSLDTTICKGDTLHWRHYVLIRDTMIRDTAKYWFGVDSVYWIVDFKTTEICPCDTAYSTLDTTIYCDSILWFDHWYYTSGTYHDTLVGVTADKCDSIGTLILKVLDTSTTEDTIANICHKDLPFIWHGKEAKDGDTIMRKNVQGCDSIITLKLITLRADTMKNTASVCAGHAYVWKRDRKADSIIYVPGNYADTVRYIETGCDSMIYCLILTIDDINRDSIAQSTCQGTPYFWRGQDRYIDSVYRDTARARTASECDTVYVLKLTINLPTAGDTTAYTCYGTPFIWHGKPAMDGDTIRRKNVAGCDSIVTLKLFVSEAPVTLPQKDTASCQMVPFIWRGHTIVSDTLCYDTIRTTKFGCDSIYASLRFVVKEPSISDTTAYVCYEDLPFIWHGKVAQNGDTIVRKNAAGCDSIVTLRLTTSTPMQTISKDTTVCDTVLPITWHGFEFNSVLIYRDTLLNTHGCDSLERIYTVNVIHCEPPVPPVPPTPTDTCLDSLVYKKWQDVIFCDNGRREFVAFQWFKDNTLMQGETKQYYFHEGGMGSSEYFVEVTYRDGHKRRTCPITFDETPRSADTYVKVQTLVRRGDNLHIQMTDDVADISIYTVVGQSVMATSVRGPLVELPLPLPTGVYVLLLHASNIDTTTKIIIE